MRLIHDTAFTEEEIESFRQIIFSNLTHGMQLVLESMPVHSLKLASRNLPYANLVQNTLDVREGQPFPCNHLGPLKSLWADPAVQEAILRGNESALPDNLTYLYTHIDRFFDAAYKPTDVDITYCRVRTTGIAETMLTMKGKQLLMVDVGGQKSERRKWIHCFQDVTAILFLASLSGYDQCLTEDWDVNQMKDAMTIWKSICASSWFKNTAIILFLNKNDIFEEKIQRSHVKAFFPQYTGPVKDAPAARQFFRREFMHIAGRTGRRQIYTHITTATDTNMLRSVMASVQDVFVNRNLEKTCMI